MCDMKITVHTQAGLTLFQEWSRAIWPIHHGVSCSLSSSGLWIMYTWDLEY